MNWIRALPLHFGIVDASSHIKSRVERQCEDEEQKQGTIERQLDCCYYVERYNFDGLLFYLHLIH
jgi:hypothetical protein